jgi:hypothetical protein
MGSICRAKDLNRVNLAVAAAVAMLISACSIANLGWLWNSEEVDRFFATLKISPDYRYWYPVPGSRTFGAYILDSKGERIGVWYSSMSAGITIDPDTKVVAITTGTPWMNGDGSDSFD